MVAVVVLACQPAATRAPSPASSAGASRPPSPASSPGAGGTSVPARVTLSLDVSGPIIRSSDGPPGYLYALPAAAARDQDGGYLLFIVWFGVENADIMTTVSRSSDGVTWDVGREPVLANLGVGNADPGPIPTAALQLDDGSWALYGWAADNSEPPSISSWRASAPEPDGPWTLDAPAVLLPGPAGSWDSLMTAMASVQSVEGGYVGWYEGQPPGSESRGDVGFATSEDGLAWQKLDEPVIERGICGPATQQAVAQPQVEAYAGGYVALLGGVAAPRDDVNIFAALSTDGRSWTCGAPAALLTSDDIPGSQGIHTLASLPLGDGRVGLVVESLGSGRSDLWWATVEVAP